MLSCREMSELVTDYVEGRLPWALRMQFLLHLALCRHCQRYLRQLKRCRDTLGRMPDEPIPEPVMDDLLHRFRYWKKEDA